MEPTTLEITSVPNTWLTTTTSMPTMTTSAPPIDFKSLGIYTGCTLKLRTVKLLSVTLSPLKLHLFAEKKVT